MGAGASTHGGVKLSAGDDAILVAAIARELESNPQRVAGLLAMAQASSGISLAAAAASESTAAGATAEILPHDDPAATVVEEQPGVAGDASAHIELVLASIFDEINSARTDPRGYTHKLQSILAQFDADGITRIVPPQRNPLSPRTPRSPGRRLLTREGVGAVNECIEEMCSMQPLAPLTQRAPGLSAAANGHAVDLGTNGSTGHTGSDASTLAQRVARHGVWQGSLAENISYGHCEASAIVAELLIDDGVASRGHRRNLLADPFRVCGIALAPHSAWSWVCCIDFAGGFSEGSRPELADCTVRAVCDGGSTMPPEVENLLGIIAHSHITAAVNDALVGVNAHVGTVVTIDARYSKSQAGEVTCVIEDAGAQTRLVCKLY